jgi:hypothetical protein
MQDMAGKQDYSKKSAGVSIKEQGSRKDQQKGAGRSMNGQKTAGNSGKQQSSRSR